MRRSVIQIITDCRNPPQGHVCVMQDNKRTI